MDAAHPILQRAQRWRRQRYSARPFALTILAITFIVLLAWAKDRRAEQTYTTHSLQSRDLIAQDEECRLVHLAHDQCAFVLANCPDEEAGVFSYLTLYYCRLPHAKPLAFTIMTLWLALLFSTIGIAASDFFCVNLNTISRLLGMSESLAGVTLLAFGNGSPDVFSTFAAFRTHAASLAIGELIGAACFITAVVSGSMALIRPFAVARKAFMRDVTFFLVAAAFSMAFIVDGKLHLWESLTMVAFYIFYVIFVVIWHWWISQRKKRRQKAAAMRSHYITPGGDEEEIPEYHDEEASANARTPQNGVSADDFAALERAGDDDPLTRDENEEQRERWMGELSNNMRLSRPPIGSRRPTHTAIRPSLVGALEFRAVLSALQKSRNIQAMPINLRRYSDDPTYTTAQQQDNISSNADPAARPAFDVTSVRSDLSPQVTRPNLEVQLNMGNRARAVSTNDLDRVTLHPSTLQAGSLGHQSTNNGGNEPRLAVPLSPTISLSPPGSQSSRDPSPAPHHTKRPSSSRLAPPGAEDFSERSDPKVAQNQDPESLDTDQQRAPPSLKLMVPGATTPPVAFPAYNDFPWSAHSQSRPASLRPPSISASPDSVYPRDPFLMLDQPKIPKWWPSNLLPPPCELLSTLFPTLTNWTEKSIWEKALGVVASLPVFLLTITLPVVESQGDQSDDDVAQMSLDLGLPPPMTPIGGSMDSRRSEVVKLPGPEHRSSNPAPRSGSGGTAAPNYSSLSTTASSEPPQVLITSSDTIAQSPEQLPVVPSPTPKHWNRWLVIVQCFTAPFFVVLILWANLTPDSPRTLARHTLWSLLASLLMLSFLLITTTPTRPPRWRTMLCALGFVVAIAWISTIANEVVGVLRALGVVLNMSDAILGLTIFAVGNSLGDLVADITVARLGFPVMALSACFGGPMLNILLGIGVSGTYMTVLKSEHKHDKHPERPIKFRPYHIDVSTTLVISGATLLVTLAGLLAAVPWRKWKMDRVIGWGLVGMWSLSTLANVLVEVLGFSSGVS